MSLPWAKLWRLKGFWQQEAIATSLSEDGVHLSQIGNNKLFHNIRTAIVTCYKQQHNKPDPIKL